MGWDIYLQDAETKCEVEVPSHEEGGTYAVGGSSEAHLKVTYNYGDQFRFGQIDGLTGAESTPILEEAVLRLGMVRSPNYWDSTPGNAGWAANILLGWARLHPRAVWYIWF